MNISFCKKSALALSLFVAVFSHGAHASDQANAAPNSTNDAAITEQLQKNQLDVVKAVLSQIMDNLVTRSIRQIERIEELLQDLSLAVNNDAIGGENKKELLQQIKDIRSVIISIKSEAFVQVTPRTLQFLAVFTDMLMTHISESVKDGFKELPPLGKRLAAMQKKAVVPMEVQDIELKLEQNEQKLAQLNVDAHEIGLTWRNKFFRKINNLLVIAHKRKWDQLAIGSSSTKTTAVGCLIGIAWWPALMMLLAG